MQHQAILFHFVLSFFCTISTVPVFDFLVCIEFRFIVLSFHLNQMCIYKPKKTHFISSNMDEKTRVVRSDFCLFVFLFYVVVFL